MEPPAGLGQTVCAGLAEGLLDLGVVKVHLGQDFRCWNSYMIIHMRLINFVYSKFLCRAFLNWQAVFLGHHGADIHAVCLQNKLSQLTVEDNALTLLYGLSTTDNR